MVRRKYRSQAGIVLDILEALEAEGPMPATRLTYYANIPYDRLRIILEGLVTEGLVERDDDRYYRITGKGVEALRVLRETRRLLESMGFKL